jgi:hypothetical protein
MPRKQPKFEYAIICDDIREEIGNKLTFVGTYADVIIVKKLPHSFPKLCFFVQYKNITAGDRFLLELTDPSNKRLEKAKNIILPGGTREGKLRLLGVFAPIKIEKEGRYALKITVNDNTKKIQEIIFNIKQSAS